MCSVCFVPGFDAEIPFAIMSKVNSGHRRGRRARTVVPEEGSTVDPRLKGEVLGPPIEPTAGTLADLSPSQMPTRCRASASGGSSPVWL